MTSFKVNKVLPENLIIKSVDNHLYRIGINHVNNSEVNDRNIIHNPILIAIVCWIQVFKNILHLTYSGFSDYNMFLYLGDWPRLMGMRYHFNAASLLVAILAISSHIIWFINYRNGIKPTFLHVFQMMSGKVSPKSIGLTNQSDIIFLLKQTRRLIKITQIKRNFFSK